MSEYRARFWSTCRLANEEFEFRASVLCLSVKLQGFSHFPKRCFEFPAGDVSMNQCCMFSHVPSDIFCLFVDTTSRRQLLIFPAPTNQKRETQNGHTRLHPMPCPCQHCPSTSIITSTFHPTTRFYCRFTDALACSALEHSCNNVPSSFASASPQPSALRSLHRLLSGQWDVTDRLLPFTYPPIREAQHNDDYL